MPLTPELLLLEVEDLLRTMPARAGFGVHVSDDHLSWLGRAEAVVTAWNSAQAIFFQSDIKRAHSPHQWEVDAAIPGIIRYLHRVRHDLRMKISGPLAVPISQGKVFDYFDEVRKVIELAKDDILFVDPYLDADFVPRYLPHVPPDVPIRLMGRERMATLRPAVDLYQQQTGVRVDLRSASGFHDRFIFVDRTICYSSGASFSDGGRKTPTTLMQVTDACQAVMAMYEEKWATARN